MAYFEARMHQIRFRLGSDPDSAEKAYSAPQISSLISGAYFEGKGGEGIGRGYKRETRRREGKEKRKGMGRNERGSIGGYFLWTGWEGKVKGEITEGKGEEGEGKE